MGNMKGHEDQIREKLLSKKDTYNFMSIGRIQRKDTKFYYITLFLYPKVMFVPPMYCDVIGIVTNDKKVIMKLPERDVYAFISYA